MTGTPLAWPHIGDLHVKLPGDVSDRDRVDCWPDNGIVGGQLGPNRNGREW